MEKFDKGETVCCALEVRNSAGVLVDPATSTKITILNPSDTPVVNEQNMTPGDTGKYSYDYSSPSTAVAGVYNVTYTAVDGSRTAIHKDKFTII